MKRTQHVEAIFLDPINPMHLVSLPRPYNR